jgi:NAD-dependent oxidoreductase involved in siderophore biosynthesis
VASPHDRVRVALIGYGMGGRLFHAPFIAAEPRLDLTAVVTANQERRLDVLSRYPGTDVVGRTEDLLEHLDGIDLVVVSTPNATHAAVAEAVLSRGKPAVVDKPVTPTSCAGSASGNCTDSNRATNAGNRRSRPIRGEPGRTMGNRAPASAFSSTSEAT